jgi:hypothetical protein
METDLIFRKMIATLEGHNRTTQANIDFMSGYKSVVQHIQDITRRDPVWDKSYDFGQKIECNTRTLTCRRWLCFYAAKLLMALQRDE